jgi:hypothetical protein
LWIALAIATGMHLSLTRIAVLEAEQRTARPLTTQFVKREPRLTKPLELKKRPKPKQRRVRREMVSVRARARDARVGVRFQPAQVLRGLARPDVRIGRVVGSGGGQAEPETFAGIIEGRKEEEHKIDLSLEMMDVGSLDTGQYQAMVIQDPTDRQSVRGFLYITAAVPLSSGDPPTRYAPALRRFIELGMNRFTDIRTEMWPPVTFDSAEIFKVPWLFAGQRKLAAVISMKLTDSEQRNLGAYLVRGGFLHADAPPPTNYEPYRPPILLRQMIADALDTQGMIRERDWTFERLESRHALYHCYFDFDGPPPGYGSVHALFSTVPFMDGVSIDRRLVAITSQISIAQLWQVWGKGYGGSGQDVDCTRGMQFGVNVVVFALTQEGSITHRVMESVH